LAELPETGITQTESITVTVSETGGIGVSVTGIGQTSVEHGGVVDQRGGGGDDTSGTGKDGGLGVSITSLSLGGGLGEQGEVCGLGLSDLGGVLGSDGELGVEDGSDEGLGVEGGGNQGLRVEGGSNGKSRVLNTESESISNIFDGLELAVGINIAVSAAHTGVGVSDLVLGDVQVAVAIVQVSEFILSMELASDIGGRGIGGIGSNGGSGVSGGSSISSGGISWGSSDGGSGSSIAEGGIGASNKSVVDGYNLLGSVGGSSENC